jgi:hypothetical protein
MPAPTIIFPASFSATASLLPNDCARIEQLTADQRAELESGRAYLYAVNHPDAPRRRKIEPLPKDFRTKVAVYCEELMARKIGIRSTLA